MKTNAENNTNHITTKIFLGCVLTSEIKFHLQNSHAWKLAKIENPDILTTTPFQGKEYIGLSLPHPQLTLAEIRPYEASIRQNLSTFCPKLQFDNVNIHIFPQLLVS